MFLRANISFVAICLALFVNVNLKAQAYQLKISHNPLELKYQTKVDSLQLNYVLQSFINRYKTKGYFNFNVDSIVWKKPDVMVYVYLGEQMKLSKIKVVDDSGYERFPQFQLRYGGVLYDSSSAGSLAEIILQNNENNGYPFSNIQVESVFNDQTVDYLMQIRRGEYFVFDSGHIDGDQVIRKAFLEAYTGIKKGKPYNEALYKKAHEKLNRLPFLYSERFPQIAFLKGGIAKPFYYLRKRKSDQLNGIIGLAPSNSTAVNTPSVVFTGEFLLRLNNLFKSGKMLMINWKSFKARSQELKTAFNYPYILSKPIGADFSLSFTKYDTLYTTFQTQVGFQYFTSGVNGFKFFYQVSGTNLGFVDTASIRSSKQFPAINSLQLKMYGLTAAYNLLDHRFNPREGWLIDAEATVGTKTILVDNMISEVRFGNTQYNLYDSNKLVTNQYQIRAKIDKYLPVGIKGTVKLGLMTAHIIAPRIYFNEMFREGGINSLKGFNEQSIFATGFNMLEVEYRYLIGENAHLKAFWNGAYYEDNSYGRTSKITDTPWGFGIGANLQTGAGILSIMYALGKEKGNAFDLRTGKVHFGLSSYF